MNANLLNSSGEQATEHEVATLVVVCDFSRSQQTPAGVLRWLLKRIGRVFGVRCVRCNIVKVDAGKPRRGPG